jgi:hypothetical protein
MVRVLLVFIVASLAWSFARAEEVDDFLYPASMRPASSSVAIDKIVNDEMTEFVRRTNSAKDSCERKTLSSSALFFFDQNFSRIGNKIRDAADPRKSRKFRPASGDPNKDDENLKLFFSSRLYRGTDMRARRLLIEGVVVGDARIGIDKIDHLFGNGGLLWAQFEAMDPKDPERVKKILAMSTKQEHGLWGLAITGVKSYGDLAANWSGFNFYRELLDGPNPYFICEKGVLLQKRKFKIADYASKAWTESVNCSAFDTHEHARIIARKLAKEGLACPQDMDGCKAIIEKYKNAPDVLTNVVSPVCRGLRKFEDSVEGSAGFKWTDVVKSAGGIRSEDVLNVVNEKQGAVQ